jgi:D-sedoheptulose 7-phosphate isomerase
MTDPREDAVLAHLRRSRDALERAADDRAFVAAVLAIAARLAAALREGGRLLVAGNGGSAADSLHIAAEFVGRFTADRAPLPAVALAADTASLTAIGNDYGFAHVFERQVRALGRRGDVLLALSTSGRSPNIIAALEAARELGLVTVGFTRIGEVPMRAHCDLVLAVPAQATALIQQVHMAAAHAICGLVERELFGIEPQG